MEEYSHEQIHYELETGMRLEIADETGCFVSKHWHNSFEIIYVIDGTMKLTVGNHDYSLTDGGFAVVNSKTIHSTACPKRCRYLLLQIPYETIKKNIPDIDIVMIRCVCLKEENVKGDLVIIRDILKKIISFCESPKNSGYLLMQHSLVYELLYHLVINFKTGVDPEMKKKADRNIQRLGIVLQYVRQHYAENITLNDAARTVALNREYFSRFFKKYMGMTFMDYVFAIRLEHAYDDIVNTDYSIGSIAEQNGFEKNYKLFVRKFREQYGCNPGEKRNQLKSI
ncbi:AraC family transcriptional regulator [Porcipelethomonas sp.]|uniref:AraC family transcriptional regulator n=1 Tax=Porcipelethomonas sp. TaxID=2981675 RepID=UPI003EF7C5E2